jgi:hypothetical protein
MSRGQNKECWFCKKRISSPVYRSHIKLKNPKKKLTVFRYFHLQCIRSALITNYGQWNIEKFLSLEEE